MTRVRSPLITSLLKLTEQDLVPRLRESGKAGNLPFGAAILDTDTLIPLLVATNKVRESPILHGETNCIHEYFLQPESRRSPPSETIFYSTHEPCSLCLSAIAWNGFPTVYYLFSYEDTRDKLGISGDIDILEEVFRVRSPGDTDESLKERPLYNRQNKYFTIKPVSELIDAIEDEAERDEIRAEAERVKALWAGLIHPKWPPASS